MVDVEDPLEAEALLLANAFGQVRDDEGMSEPDLENQEFYGGEGEEEEQGETTDGMFTQSMDGMEDEADEADFEQAMDFPDDVTASARRKIQANGKSKGKGKAHGAKRFSPQVSAEDDVNGEDSGDDSDQPPRKQRAFARGDCSAEDDETPMDETLADQSLTDEKLADQSPFLWDKIMALREKNIEINASIRAELVAVDVRDALVVLQLLLVDGLSGVGNLLTYVKKKLALRSAMTLRTDHPDAPGAYSVRRVAVVTKNVSAASQVLGKVRAGDKLSITEVQLLEDEARVRGHVNEPCPGWVSLSDTSDGHRWAVCLDDEGSEFTVGSSVVVQNTAHTLKFAKNLISQKFTIAAHSKKAKPFRLRLSRGSLSHWLGADDLLAA